MQIWCCKFVLNVHTPHGVWSCYSILLKSKFGKIAWNSILTTYLYCIRLWQPTYSYQAHGEMSTFASLWEGTKEQEKKLLRNSVDQKDSKKLLWKKKELFMLTIAAVKLLAGIGQISYEEVCRKTQLSVNCIRNWAGG